MILARHAEALFWAGRQLERAESTVRALNAMSQSFMHLPRERATTESLQLIRALGLADGFDAGDGDITSVSVAEFLCVDGDNPGSVVATVTQLRENFRVVRDRVPVELWEEANRLHLLLATGDLPAAIRGEPFKLYADVREGCQAMSGVVAEAMPRDEGHTFLVVGRALERAIMTCRLLRVSWSVDESLLDTTTLLRSVSSLQAYRRIEGYEVDRDVLTAFLLCNESVPRTVISCLHRAESLLGAFDSSSIGLSPAHRVASRLRSQLEYGDIEAAIADDPVELLLQVEDDLMELVDLVAVQAFHPTQTAEMHAQWVRPEAGSP